MGMGFFQKKELTGNGVTATVDQSENGYRFYKKEYFIEERSDALVDHNIRSSKFIFKYTVVVMLLTFLFTVATSAILIFRKDSDFYATSPNGQVWKLNTRETPKGSFEIQEYKGK